MSWMETGELGALGLAGCSRPLARTAARVGAWHCGPGEMAPSLLTHVGKV